MIIDFNNLFARAYYAFKQKGDDFAVYGFINILLNLIDQWNPAEVFLAVDSPYTWRHRLYEGYKGQRNEKPNDYVPQAQKTLRILIDAGFNVLQHQDFEADDIIATIVHRHSGPWMVVSNDKDLLQLCFHQNQVLRPTKGIKNAELWDGKRVYEEFGITAAQIPDYLALVGDASDNIPGAKGIGPKIAVKLLQDFDDMRGIYKNLYTGVNPRTRAILIRNQEIIDTCRHLTQLQIIPDIIIGLGEYDVKRLHRELSK